MFFAFNLFLLFFELGFKNNSTKLIKKKKQKLKVLKKIFFF